MIGPDESHVMGQVARELERAQAKFAPMHSPHEGLAVIEEEYIELREYVYTDRGRSAGAAAEAIQIAAMAVRYAVDLRAGRTL